ncbi:phenylacetate-CoA ligase [Dokdonia sp. Hel_I_63]|uniref:phenylacetate--CoA ligase family protein n=1 Tax=Dokdonia sp. Hel_I_63 TaxID=1249996 RepID=UPI00119AC127|nr:phenylacetate-CoA ligase [Dokdonia sp. Hel_I_63]
MKGFDTAFAKAELQRIIDIPESEYAAYISEQKKKIVTHHEIYNSFYRSLLTERGEKDWETLPVLTKANLQQPLENRLSQNYDRKTVYVGKTSGSSGHPFVFAKDKDAHALSWVSFQKRYNWYSIDLDTSKQARFYGIPLTTIAYQKERLKDKLGNRYRFPIFDLCEHKLAGMVKKFSKTPFDYINGYTSSIVLLAKHLRKHQIILTDICPTLKACIVTSEMLFPEDLQLMEEQFNVPIINEYGASEVGLIAFQNKENQLEVDSELLFVEILDDKDKPVPHGVVGRIVITSFYNKAHPFIRYDIGDMGSLSPLSTLKKPILENLQGRTSDMARLPSGKVVPGLTFYYVTKSIIEENDNVSEFIIEQTAQDSFTFIYTSERPLSDLEKRNIAKATSKYLENGLKLRYEKVDVMDRRNRGKLKQFTSLVS